MTRNQDFDEAIALARKDYMAAIAQGDAVAAPVFEAASASFSDPAVTKCAIAQLRFNLRNSFFALALSEYNDAVVRFEADELADPGFVYLALAKCKVGLESSFDDITKYETALEVCRATSTLGAQLYPDLMDELLDVAENREIIATEIAESKEWLIREVERRK